MAVKNVSFYGQGQRAPIGGGKIQRDYQTDPRRQMEQQLMAQGGSMSPVQSSMEGITRALSGVTGGYFAGQGKRDLKEKEAAYSGNMAAMTRALVGGQPIPRPAPSFVGPMGQTKGGIPAALATLPQGAEYDSVRNQLGMQMYNDNLNAAAAQAARKQELADIKAEQDFQIKLKGTPGGPNSPTGRPASSIQEKEEYDRLLAGPGGKEAADAYLRDFVNKPWMDLGGTMVPRAGAGRVGVPSPSVPITLNPGDEPEVRSDQALAAKVGADSGTAINELAAADASMPGLVKSVERLKEIGKTATYTLGGQVYNYARQQTGYSPSEGAKGRATYIAHVKNNVLPLLRQTFGAAFTVAEGDSLLATLGDPNMHPDEKNAVLDAFIENKRRDLETKRRRVSSDAGGDDPLGIR